MAFRFLHTGDWHLGRVFHAARLGAADGPIAFYPAPGAEPVLVHEWLSASETALLAEVLAGRQAAEGEAAP